jgi:hypothetical protein
LLPDHLPASSSYSFWVGESRFRDELVPAFVGDQCGFR